MHSVEDKAISPKVVHHKKPYMRALIFLGIIVLITIAAAIFNSTLQNDISQLTKDISDTQQKIDEMNAGSNLLQASALLEKNKAVLEKLEQRSKIVTYINHISDISLKYGVAMSGFEYGGNTIALQLLSTTKNQQSLAYQNIVKLLSDYNADDKRLFEIGYISNITGHDNIKFPVSFQIK